MRSSHRAPWRTRFVLLALGLAIGFLAKWFAGHYQQPENGLPAEGDTPKRKVVRLDHDLPLGPPHYSLYLEVRYPDCD